MFLYSQVPFVLVWLREKFPYSYYEFECQKVEVKKIRGVSVFSISNRRFIPCFHEIAIIFPGLFHHATLVRFH